MFSYIVGVQREFENVCRYAHHFIKTFPDAADASVILFSQNTELTDEIREDMKKNWLISYNAF